MGQSFRGMSTDLQTLCQIRFPRFTEKRFYSEPVEEEEDYYFEAAAREPLKRHVFADVWERTLDPRSATNQVSDTDTWTIDWRQWPPDIPKVSSGVKIPVNRVNNVELRIMEALPIASGSSEFYENLKGLFNSYQTTSIQVHPPALLFLHSKADKFYSVKLRLKNVDIVPRRVKIFSTKNPCFEVVLGGQNTTIFPGLSIPISVNFRPNTNASINEVLFIAVEGDGGLTVPLISASEPPPVLEIEEWDCGCSVVSSSRLNTFYIKNLGSEGRFWLLTEDEFRYQFLSLQTPHAVSESVRQDTLGKLVPPDISEDPRSPRIEETKLERNGACRYAQRQSGPGTRARDKSKMTRIITGPFVIDPSCFKLMRNQKIKIKVNYFPTVVGFHYEKLAMMCDNGEVRWIAVKGMGLGMETQSRKLIELQAEPYWTAPPIDLPFDENCGYSIDFADLVPGDVGKAEFKAVNKSCIPMYFFWSVRSLKSDFGQGQTNGRDTERVFSQKYLEGTVQPLEWENQSSPWLQAQDLMAVKVGPSQGILLSKQEVNFVVSAPCPRENGYYGFVISLFVEQVDEASIALIKPFVKQLEDAGINNVPVHLEDLNKSMSTLPQYPTSLNEETLDALEEEGLEFIMQPKNASPLKRYTRHSNSGHGGPGGSEGKRGSRTLEMTRGQKALRPSKLWKNVDVKPVLEVEIWLRSVPLLIQFNPPFIVANGVINSTIERTISVYNDSQWPVEINWKNLMDVAGTVLCDPFSLVVKPQERSMFTAKICFKMHGKVVQDLTGIMNIIGSSTRAPISIQCSISSHGPFIVSLTPLIHFGFMKIFTERVKTLAIKNTGDRPARWIASVNAEGLYDEQNRNISPFNRNIEGLKLLRVWPNWGVLGPLQTLGINVYLSGEIEGDIVASVKVIVEGIPETALYVPICAVVQSPLLYLEESEIQIDQETLVSNNVEDYIITLYNPTGFPLSFIWQSCLVGRQSQLVTAEFCPTAGFVPPRGTMDCILTITLNDVYATLRNVYATCLVDGMKEPLILKISTE